MIVYLEGLAAAFQAQGDVSRAARLFGAAEMLRETIRFALPLPERHEYERRVQATRAGLGETAFASAWAEGRAMSLEQAIAHALETGASRSA